MVNETRDTALDVVMVVEWGVLTAASEDWPWLLGSLSGRSSDLVFNLNVPLCLTESISDSERGSGRL
jgi:hypothetical protein